MKEIIFAKITCPNSKIYHKEIFQCYWKDVAVWTWDSTEYHSMFSDKPKRPAGGDATEGYIPFYTHLAAF